MDSFTLTTTYTRFFPLKKPNFSFISSRPSTSFLVLASKDEPKLDKWDQMELKFGRMLGEDPKLTLAKIAGRKANPDVSYLEIEKAFNKKNFQIGEFVEEFQRRPASNSGLNLVRPVPKKGVKFEVDDNDNKPYESQKNKARPSSAGHAMNGITKGSSIPNVILRKPSAAFPEDDIDVKKSSRLTIKPNLSLRMSKGETKDNFSDITLLKKPEPSRLVIDADQDKVNLDDSEVSSFDLSNMARNDSLEPLGTSNKSFLEGSKIEVKSTPLEQSDFELDGKEASITQSEVELLGKPPRLDLSLKDNSSPVKEEATNLISEFELDEKEVSVTQPEVELQGKPPRLDQSLKDTSTPVKEEATNLGNVHAEIEDFISAVPLQEREDADWSRAEYISNTGGREEVELISCSTRGFVASFGSLIGFLPYRNLGAKWKFLAFESWLRKKGLDPSMYRQNLGIVGAYESLDKNRPLDANLTAEKVEGKMSPNMNLEDLLEIYDQEKIKFLSSFVGLRIKVNIVLADRKSRKLMFSGKPKEKEELVQKKRSLMAKLNVGDVMKCCIKKITYFGIFVEVEGVPALIHQSEVSWDATLDPSSFFKIGQIVEAKVHQLDFALDRIMLSLKEIMPDPLIEALESVVGDSNLLDRKLEAAQADIEWADVESLIKELEDIEGVQSVSKGRFFLSPGLAPTFQVYMASMFQNQYKLLARSGNKVQEVIVQASLDKEEMKAAILACTNRVE